MDSVVLKPFEKVRKRVNREVERFMALEFGFSYRHVDLDLEGSISGFIGMVEYTYLILAWT